MAVIEPLSRTQVQTPTLEPGLARTKLSEEETNSQLLDTFLQSRTETALSCLTSPRNKIPSNTSDYTILNLPLGIIREILRSLLTSPTPLILQPDSSTTTDQGYRTYVEPEVLQVCKVFYHIGVPILYGENTLTAPSPAASLDFDEHLFSLQGSKRQMIRHVKLEIDWADGLWAKFPLLARALGELKGLVGLEIRFVEDGKRDRQTVVVGKDANLDIRLVYGQGSTDNTSTARHRRTSAVNGADCRMMKREGSVADVMLKAEMKMLKDLVVSIRGLKTFRLIGFRDRVFARWLEEHVRIGKHQSHGMYGFG